MFHKFNPEATLQDEIDYLTEQLRRVDEWRTNTDFIFDGNRMAETVINAADPFIADMKAQIAALRDQLVAVAA